MVTAKDGQTNNEKASFDKRERIEEILNKFNKTIEEYDLKSPDEEVMENFKSLLEILPEGKLRKIGEMLEKPAETSAWGMKTIGGVEDFGWKLIKPLLEASGVSWVALIPDDINSKLVAGFVRLVGKMQKASLKGVMGLSEKVAIKMKEIKERGGSGEEMIRGVKDIVEPEEAINEILD